MFKVKKFGIGDLVIIIFFIIIFTVGVIGSEKRTKDLGLTAQKMGFSFSKENDLLMDQINLFDLMQKGNSKGVSNIITGKYQNNDVYIFDYSYTTGGGKDKSHSSQTVVLFIPQGGTLEVLSLSEISQSNNLAIKAWASAHPGLVAEITGNKFLIYYPNQQISPEALINHYQECIKLFDLLLKSEP